MTENQLKQMIPDAVRRAATRAVYAHPIDGIDIPAAQQIADAALAAGLSAWPGMEVDVVMDKGKLADGTISLPLPKPQKGKP